MVVLTGEKVDVYFLRDATNGELDLMATEGKDKSGRLVHGEEEYAMAIMLE